MDEADSDETTLATLRELSGLSQMEVARRMGVSKARPGQIERDFPNVRFSVVQAYIRALGGMIEFVALSSGDVWADQIVQDPAGPRDHGDRTKLRVIQGGFEPSEDDVLCDDEQDDDEEREAAAWRVRRQRRKQTHPWPAI